MKIRAIANNHETGQKRYQLYKKVHERINESIEKGFHLEAISLIESLISDRLESRITFLKGNDFSFKTLESLIRRIEVEEDDREFKLIVLDELKEWKNDRNKALHEMAKMEINDTETWEERMVNVQKIAEDGKELLKKIKKREQKLRNLSQ